MAAQDFTPFFIAISARELREILIWMGGAWILVAVIKELMKEGERKRRIEGLVRDQIEFEELLALERYKREKLRVCPICKRQLKK